MAIGASGQRIQILGRITRSQPNPGGTNTIVIAYQLSEQTVDGNPHDGTVSGEAGFDTVFEPTDSEIEATLRTQLAAQLTADLTPVDAFLGTDVRGVKL